MSGTNKLDYEIPRPKPGPKWPPDWRRRAVIAAIAAPIIFLVTLETARRAQSRAVSYMQSDPSENRVLRDMQKAVDHYTRANGSPPRLLTEVPEIQSSANAYPGYLVDHWGTPFMLQAIDGRPTVVSYGRDGLPGGEGLNADATADKPYGTERVTMGQFLRYTHLAPVFWICAGNALLVGYLAFVGEADSRNSRGLVALLSQLIVSAIVATVVAAFIAMVHAPSGH